MVLSRAAFGRRGAYLPAAMQGLLAIGWCAINTWIILDLVVALFDKIGIHGGDGLKIAVAIVIMAIQVWLAAIGFRAIAAVRALDRADHDPRAAGDDDRGLDPAPTSTGATPAPGCTARRCGAR